MKKPSGLSRRTNKSIIEHGGYKTAEEIFKLIAANVWPYKSEQRDPLIKRDKALVAIDLVGAFRNNEPLKSLTRANFTRTNNYLILSQGRISKRSRKLIAKEGAAVMVRTNILFPMFQHPLQAFTNLVLDYPDAVSKDDTVLFNLKESRHYHIVSNAASQIVNGKRVKGKWVHWLRAQGENWYGHNVFVNDPVSLEVCQCGECSKCYELCWF